MEAMKELEGTAAKEPDKELAGGLKVPGGIWSQLYPLVLLPVCLHLHGDLGMHVVVSMSVIQDVRIHTQGLF